MNRVRCVAAGAFAVALLLSACPVRVDAQDAKEDARQLTVEEIFAHGSLTGHLPGGVAWSPDGAHLTYLQDDELMDLDPLTGKAHTLVTRAKLASLNNNTANEKDRDHRSRYGQASYLWAPDSKHLLFDANGNLWLYDLATGTGLAIGYTGAGSGDDPKFSPDGKLLSYVRDHGLQVVHLREPGTPKSDVAATSNPAVMNGEVDWVYLEELKVRSNYFWSPDSKSIAYLQMDETRVPEYPLTDWIPTHPAVDKQRYPQPGDPNPEVRVGVVSERGGKTVWVKLPGSAFKSGDDYIPRFGWVDRRTLWVETLNREQKRRSLYFADAASGNAKLMLDITDDKFLPDEYELHFVEQHLLLTSWSDGYQHIYLYSYDGGNPIGGSVKLEKQLTQGIFDVDTIASVDPGRKMVYYTSNEGMVLDAQLWRVGFDGERKQLTTASGTHSDNFAPTGGAYVDSFSSRMAPPQLSFCRVDDARCTVFAAARPLDAYHLAEPLAVTVGVGENELHATLLLPGDVKKRCGDCSDIAAYERGLVTREHRQAAVPLIVNPYGGPGPMNAQNRWGGDNFLFDQVLALHGFAVLRTDGRGSGRRGRNFAQAAYHNFGPVQLEDQLKVIDSVLSQYPELDAKRLGWWGWSWGGTFTLYALSHSHRFRAGVSVAPVTDWRDYDSIYTERYMSEPADFASGYQDFSVVNSAADLSGHLLLVHGTGDDNVHLQNTMQYVQQLITHNVAYDLQLYPRKTHSIAGGEVRPHLYNRVLAQFETYLKPPVDPGEGAPGVPAK